MAPTVKDIVLTVNFLICDRMGDLLKNVHFAPSPYTTLPIDPSGRGCVLYHSLKYYYTPTGQCCAKNPTKRIAVLVNPLVGGKFWKTMGGERDYNVECE